MSKLVVGFRGPVDYSAIHWAHTLNSRNNYGDPLADLDFVEKTDDNGTRFYEPSAKIADLQPLVYLLSKGWSDEETVGTMTPESAAKLELQRRILANPKCKDNIADVEKEILAQAYAEREKTIDDYRAAKPQLAGVLQKVWFPNGKPAKIELFANNSFRRSIGIGGAILRRIADHPNCEYPVIVRVESFDDPLAALIAHARENYGKDKGRLAFGGLDHLKLAREMIRANPSKLPEQGLMLAGLKRGTAQQASRVAVLDNKFPECKIIDRCLMPAIDGEVTYRPDGWIPYTRLDKESIHIINTGGQLGDATKKIKVRYTPALVHQALASLVSGSKPRSTMMNGKTVSTLADSSPNLAVETICRAISEGNELLFATLNTPQVCEKMNPLWLELFPVESTEETKKSKK